MRLTRTVLGCVGAAAVAFGASFALAADAEQIAFPGKQIQFLIGTGAGDTYDSYARLLGKFLAKYLPGAPLVLPMNRSGAGSLVAINAMYNAPKDGVVLAMGQRFVPLMPLLDLPGAQFDPMKMAYIGSMSQDTSVCIVHERAGISSVADARGKQIVVGTMGAGTELTNFTATLSHMLGINYKVVRGYGSSGEIDLAIERGELQGRCGVSYSSLKRTRPEWLSSGKVKVYLQIAAERAKEIPDVPALGELVSGEDRAVIKLLVAPGLMARPVFGQPDLGAERLAALRGAFDQALADKELLAEAEKEQLEIAPMRGQEMEALLKDLYGSDPAVVRRARALVAAP